MSEDAPQPDPGDLDALVRRVDPDRWLSSRFIADAQARADVIALYAYDHELARAPKVASNPLLGEIRLTWWREALDEIYEGRPVRRHPTAQALAAVVTRRGLPRAPLEAMIDARYRELDTAPMDEGEVMGWAGDTGGSAAKLAAMILDPAGPSGAARAGGALWAVAFRDAELAGRLRRGVQEGSRRVSVAAFPAIAHAALIGSRGSELGRRLRLTWAVARGRI